MESGRLSEDHNRLKCESSSRGFQPGDDPSRGLLRVADGSFTALALLLTTINSQETPGVHYT